MFKNILCMTALAAVVAPAFAAEWMTDFEAAKAKAAQENKAILVDFTGSDWCGYCIKLRKEVLDTPAFEEYAADKFVLMEVDVPRKKQLSPELKAQNGALCEKYQISGFPTLLVMDAQGRVMGGFSGYRPNLESASTPLNAALKTLELVQKADAAEGADKAELLMEAYESVPKDMRPSTNLLQQVAAADPDNTTGVQDVAKDELQSKEIEQKFRACGNNAQKIKAVIDEYLPVATPNNKKKLEEALEVVNTLMATQEVDDAFNAEGPEAALKVLDQKLPAATGDTKAQLLQAKYELQMLVAENAEDLEAAKATMLEFRAVLPPHVAGNFDAFMKKAFADPEKLLKDMKSQRDALNAERAKKSGK